MKKIAPLILALIVALTLTGCFEAPIASKAGDKDLFKISEKPDRFSLEKAVDQSEKYLEFAESQNDLMAGDDFLTYLEAAKTVQEGEILNATLSTRGQGGAASLDDFTKTLASGFSSLLGAAFSGLTNTLGGTTAVTGTTGGSKTTSGNSGAAATPKPSQADLDHLALLNYYSQFQSYKASADQTITKVSASPWLARDIVIADPTLVSIFSSSNNIFNFVKSHPGVAEGDMVLSSVGDTMASIYLLWGLGRFEAQSAFLMINIYYPGGGYIAHAEQQLSLL